MTNAERARAIAAMFDQGRDADAYNAMEWMLRNREWPAWLDKVCADVDSVTKDRPVNIREAA